MKDTLHYYVMSHCGKVLDSYWHTEEKAQKRLNKLPDDFIIQPTVPQYANWRGDILQEKMY